MSIPLDSLALRCHPKTGGEHGLCIGGTGSGKSTLAEQLIRSYLQLHPRGHVVILDSKPRFRAQLYPNGTKIRRLYKGWAHGTSLPGSVRVTTPEEYDLARKLGARLIIAQSLDLRDEPNYPMLAHIARHAMNKAKLTEPRLIVVDETLDFFGPNGQPVRGVRYNLARIARGGRELGVSGLFLSQRVKGIPAQLREALTKLWLFRFDNPEDVKLLADAGAPVEILDTPTADYIFLHWTKHNRRQVYGPMRLGL